MALVADPGYERLDPIVDRLAQRAALFVARLSEVALDIPDTFLHTLPNAPPKRQALFVRPIHSRVPRRFSLRPLRQREDSPVVRMGVERAHECDVLIVIDPPDDAGTLARQEDQRQARIGSLTSVLNGGEEAADFIGMDQGTAVQG